MDSKRRSIVKAITWKVLGFVMLPIVAIATFSQIESACFSMETDSFVVLSLAYHILMFTLFIVHERIWNGVKWGRKE
jgi:predicted membrane chloride channel (bestrophin family)